MQIHTEALREWKYDGTKSKSRRLIEINFYLKNEFDVQLMVVNFTT